MEATITTLGDIFKTKVQESFKVPTIWVDPEGNEHEDTNYERIVIDPIKASASSTKGAYYSVSQSGITGEFTYIINGLIKHVGSHVKSICRIDSLSYHNTYKVLYEGSEDLAYPYDLRDVFVYAKNLTSLYYVFSNIDQGGQYEFSIPEDIFWNCPNLKTVKGVFSNTQITEIPENLFAKNPELADVTNCFIGCQALTEIPENLFKNNLNLKDITRCFERTGISKIPNKLFESIKDKIESGEIKVSESFNNTDITKRYLESFWPLGEIVRQLKKEGLAPDYLSDKILCTMLAQTPAV